MKKLIFLILATGFVLLDLFGSFYFIAGKTPEQVAGLGRPKVTITPFPTLIVEKQEKPSTFGGDNLATGNEGEKTIKWQKLLDNIPVNPREVTATASANGYVVVLSSGKTYNFPQVTFTWSGDKAVEPGTKIIGFYVYFGPRDTEIPFPESGYENSVNPKAEGIFVAQNFYVVKELKKGQTYNLYVQAVSDSQNANPFYRFGMEQVGPMRTLSAKKLFIYKYE